ncbi:MAG TPA: hypothetical protein VF849_01425 [Blattabacteriaceae bacterium]
MNTLTIDFEYIEADKNDPMSHDDIDIHDVKLNNVSIPVPNSSYSVIKSFLQHQRVKSTTKI